MQPLASRHSFQQHHSICCEPSSPILGRHPWRALIRNLLLQTIFSSRQGTLLVVDSLK